MADVTVAIDTVPLGTPSAFDLVALALRLIDLRLLGSPSAGLRVAVLTNPVPAEATLLATPPAAMLYN